MAPAIFRHVRRTVSVLALTCLPLAGAGPVLAAPPDLGAAMDALRSGDWDLARDYAGPEDSPGRDVIEWYYLRAGKGTPDEVMDFLARNPDWPGLDWLREKSEAAFLTAPSSQVREFFGDEMAQSPEGVLIQARALIDDGEVGEAEANLVLAWRTMAMGADVQAEYLSKYGDLLRPHTESRLDRMLWDGHLASARQLLMLVGEGPQKLAQARIGLYTGAGNVDTLIAEVPAPWSSAPGLAHARFEWRARKGRRADAMELLIQQGRNAASLGEPAAWARRRADYARTEMLAGHAKRAYQLASTGFLSPADGYVYADLHWIAGYVALTMLKDPERAAGHFELFDAAVETPISKGRGGYWRGRAYEAMGDREMADLAYAEGALQQTSYYGLLAAEKLGRPFDPELVDPPEVPPLDSAPFLNSSVFEAGQMLLDAGDAVLGERFLTHLVEGLDPVSAAQLGHWAIEEDHPHLAVMIAKRAAQDGVVLAEAYYPVHDVGRMRLAMAPEMVLSIARRESEFDPTVISGAGARGLMQVMPATAQAVAVSLDLDDGHSTDRLITDWRYNATLGAEYLAKLSDQFDGNPVLMSAGYNAGPGRPVRWMAQMGDPRRADVDVVDWIEAIPFDETRNYVMRVTESLPIYRARLGLEPLPVPFSEELKGSLLKVARKQ
ncbi:lytic transglycosylase domain-containing protein [Chachezhania sediminis]|uniref:lytic transglycosylase domain-containing protein n=1 Tax=Chachezhania sediminis TaxID=2599291 RepID=UPI00131B7614|nr:lytic transglycosylase domain-containing protein [Chachezhania sediminis]